MFSAMNRSFSKADRSDKAKSVVARVPKQGTFALYKPELHKPDVTFYVSDVKFNVTKTNSLVTPIVGVITFTTTWKNPDPYQPPPEFKEFLKELNEPRHDEKRLEFAWLNNKWVFTGPADLHYYGLDSEPFLAFLAPYGKE